LALIRDTGFVLKISDFAESDLIITLFTERWGKRSAIVKRARRFNSRLGGVFDILNLVEVVSYEKSGLDLVSQGAILHGFPRLKSELAPVSTALAVLKLLERLLPWQQREGQIYALFQRFLHLLEKGEGPLSQLQLSVTLKLLSMLGHRPHLHSCMECGRVENPFLFNAEYGGVRCQSCAQGEGIRISCGLARTLNSLLNLPLERAGVVQLTEGDGKLAEGLISGYADFVISGP
jgi:DNA repair protein RecO (recombination protein O)